MDGGFGGMDGGFGGIVAENKKKPVVELPNFMLQNSLIRIKSVAFYCRRVIGESKEKGLRRFLDAKMESLAGRAAVQLKQLLDDSDTGIVDLSIRNRTGLTEEEKETRRKEEEAHAATEKLRKEDYQLAYAIDLLHGLSVYAGFAEQ